GLWVLLERCLAKSPDERYDDMAEVAKAAAELRADLREELDLMLEELEVVAPALERAARRPEANPSWKMLAAQARDAVPGRSNDHASVTRLMSALGPEYSAVMAAAPAPSPADAELAVEAGGAESMVLSEAERAYLRPSVPPVATEPVPTPSCSGDEP